MTIKAQLLQAETLGIINFENGVFRAPAKSKELMELLGEREIGVTPKGKASSIKLMDAWTKGWDKANMLND